MDEEFYEPIEIQEQPKKRYGIWAKLGGGALTDRKSVV